MGLLVTAKVDFFQDGGTASSNQQAANWTYVITAFGAEPTLTDNFGPVLQSSGNAPFKLVNASGAVKTEAKIFTDIRGDIDAHIAANYPLLRARTYVAAGQIGDCFTLSGAPKLG